MSHKKLMAALAAAAIAAGSVAATTGAAAAKAPPPPHYKPLICIFLPVLDLCAPAWPAPKKAAHKMTMKTNKPMMAKPMMAPKKY